MGQVAQESSTGQAYIPVSVATLIPESSVDTSLYVPRDSDGKMQLYRGPSVGAGRKSLAYALTYQADDRTLTDNEVSKVRGKIIKRLEKDLGAQLRA